MSDRDALRSMLIYAQREAESLGLGGVAHLLARAVVETERALAVEPDLVQTERFLRPDVAEADRQGCFGSRRLQ